MNSNRCYALSLLQGLLLGVVCSKIGHVEAFNVVVVRAPSLSTYTNVAPEREVALHMSGGDNDDDIVVDADIVNMQFTSDDEKKQAVGNLVQDDEWNGLGMELSETIRMAVIEDLKKNAREFLGKDDYKVGDITKEVDVRVKSEIAKMRNKETYELGDFTVAMDELAKSMTEEITGKPYETGDLSKVIDSKIKESVAKFCNKDTYEFGDLSKEIDTRVKQRVNEFTGKDKYEFGDVAREILKRRQNWAKENNYQFGDITKSLLGNISGKGDDYQFGDITKGLIGNIFGKKDKK